MKVVCYYFPSPQKWNQGIHRNGPSPLIRLSVRQSVCPLSRILPWHDLQLIWHCNTAFWLAESTSLIFRLQKSSDFTLFGWFLHSLVFIWRWWHYENPTRQNGFNILNLIFASLNIQIDSFCSESTGVFSFYSNI